MRKTFVLAIIGLMVHCITAQQKEFPKERQDAIKELFQKYTDLGLPGLALSVYTPDTGVWSYASGYANMEDQEPLTSAHLHYLQSVSKTYMAVIILKLYEKGKLGLNDPIRKYLDYPWLNSIQGVEKITVRMLLNHTSGLPEYSTDPKLVSRIIHDPLTVLSPKEMLSCIDGKPLEFEPGSQYRYKNTNYELLSLIADSITGDHTAFMEKVIFKKLGLKATRYLTEKNHRDDLNLAAAYWDVLLEAIPVNVSKMQRANVASMRGDDGLVATTEEAVRFLKGLVEGKLLKPETLELMQEWVVDEQGERKYGLGVLYYDLDVTYGIGHSGGGIGAGCVLVYLPELNAILFLATNFNTMMESPIRKKAENLQMDVLSTLFADPQP